MTSRSAVEVGAVAGAEVDETHRDGAGVVGERIANDLGRHETVRRLEPLQVDRAESLRGARGGDGETGELGAREHSARRTSP